MTVPDAVRLRTADEADVEAIAGVFLAAWQMVYRDVLPARLVDMYDPASAQDLWRRAFARGPGSRVVVAERPGTGVVGVVAFGRDPDARAVGHIFSLYVHPDAQGLGVGAQLVHEAVDSFRADGRVRASLWVFKANDAARAFYERLGWRPDGGTRVEAEYGESELRLTLALR